MRELEYKIERAFAVGLRPYDKAERADSGLLEAMNCRVGPLGLEPYVPIERLTTAVRDWPMPQYLEGPESFEQFVVFRDALGHPAADALFRLNGSTPVFIYEMPHGPRLDIADFVNYRVFTNGVTQIQVPAVGVPIAGATATVPLFGTCCNFNGQCVAGNIASSWYNCDEKSVIWSAIGSIDFTPDISNVAGFRKMPSEVYAVRSFNNQIIVYGEKQIDWLIPVSDPAPTFGRKLLLPKGIAGRYTHCGDELTQIFIDEEGYLWRLEAGASPKLLGYKEFITRMNASNIVLSFDRYRRDCYIADGELAFLLSPYGLTEIHQVVSGMVRLNGALVGDYEDRGRHDFRVLVDTFDLGYRGEKTLITYEMGWDVASKASMLVGWRTDRAKLMEFVGPTPVNRGGIATMPVSGVEFQLALEAQSYEDVNLNYIKVRYKMTDLRSLRGIYAPPPRGQSDQSAAS